MVTALISDIVYTIDAFVSSVCKSVSNACALPFSQSKCYTRPVS